MRTYPALGRDAFASVISAVMQITYCISFAALIFTGPISGGFSLGLAALIMGAAVTCLTLSVTSSFTQAVGGPDSPTAAVMSVVAGSVAAALTTKGVSEGAIIINVLVALSMSALCVGLFLFSIGALKFGEWLRLIPYPVIGRFLAASGPLADHRQHGGGDAKEHDAVEHELGGYLLGDVCAADPARRIVCPVYPVGSPADSRASWPCR